MPLIVSGETKKQQFIMENIDRSQQIALLFETINCVRGGGA